MTNNKKNIDPEKVADSAEKQLLSLKKAQDDKIQEVKQEQQKKDLLKLTNLFEDECNNFYTYNTKNNSFGVLSKSEDIEER